MSYIFIYIVSYLLLIIYNVIKDKCKFEYINQSLVQKKVTAIALCIECYALSLNFCFDIDLHEVDT